MFFFTTRKISAYSTQDGALCVVVSRDRENPARLGKGKTDMTSAKLLQFKSATINAGLDAKTIKGNGQDYITAIQYMTPYKTMGANLCPMAETAGCLDGCLNTAGRGQMNSVQAARQRKAVAFVSDRAAYVAQLALDIARFAAWAKRKGLKPAVRLNGTTDIRWENIPVEYKGARHENIFAAFPDVQFYDYTKIANRRLDIANYHLTFSYSAASALYLRQLDKALARGMSVAVVFRDKENIPSRFLGMPTFDGDKNDMRFLDPARVVVALYAKGDAKRDTTGFVVDYVAQEVAA